MITKQKLRHSRFQIFPFSLFFLMIIMGCMSCSNSNKDKLVRPADSGFMDTHNVPVPTQGHFLYAGPKVMELNKTETISVSITTDSIRDMPKFLDDLGENDTTIVEEIRIGRIMEVRLMEEDPLSNNFRITSLSSQEQVVDKHSPTSWSWTVFPLQIGQHKLVVIARIKMLTAGLELIGYKDLPVFERAVEVKVAEKTTPSTNNLLADWFYMLIGLLFLGFLGWLIFRLVGKGIKKMRPTKEITAEDYRKFNFEVEELIENDKLDAALEVFEQFAKQNGLDKMTKRVIHLKSDHFNNRSMFNRNLIDNQEFRRNRSKVVNELLGMMGEVEVKES